MAQPTQLFPGATHPESPLESPEVLVLNALLGSGRFDPYAYGLDVDMLASHQQAWRWCQDYQDKVGNSPPVELFARTFPTIEIVGGVDPRWAADQLRHAHYEREVRRKLGEASRAMREGDLEAVRDAVRELVQPSPLSKPKGMNITDIDSMRTGTVVVGFNVPWAPLNSVTNGHARGDFWLIGARLGAGKSQLIPCFAVEAAKQGAKVAIASCEMPMRQYVSRIHRRQAHGDVALQRALKSFDEDTRVSALGALPPLSGSIEVFDPSVMRMNLRGVENLCSEYDVVWVDHVGLLQDNNGKRSIEDWRVAAVVSNSLREMNLRYNVALGAAVQINRQGDSGLGPPKVSEISQTDALGQDATVVVTLRRIGERSMLHSAGKVREGHGVRWYTKFEPETADFSEITADEARLRAMQDGDRAANE